MNKSRREEVLRRDEWECQDCGIELGEAADPIPTAEVHHIVAVAKGGTDDSDNLVTLCPNCHSTKPGKEYSGRSKIPPLPGEVYSAMEFNEPYVAGDLRVAFEDEYSPSHSTIRNRLAELVADGRVEKKTHVSGGVTYWKVV